MLQHGMFFLAAAVCVLCGDNRAGGSHVWPPCATHHARTHALLAVLRLLSTAHCTASQRWRLRLPSWRGNSCGALAPPSLIVVHVRSAGRCIGVYVCVCARVCVCVCSAMADAQACVRQDAPAR
jgi:hypothetical protein